MEKGQKKQGHSQRNILGEKVTWEDNFSLSLHRRGLLLHVHRISVGNNGWFWNAFFIIIIDFYSIWGLHSLNSCLEETAILEWHNYDMLSSLKIADSKAGPSRVWSLARQSLKCAKRPPGKSTQVISVFPSPHFLPPPHSLRSTVQHSGEWPWWWEGALWGVGGLSLYPPKTRTFRWAPPECGSKIIAPSWN